MQSEIDPEKLAQHWIHSREEDTAEETVFRTNEYDFPPARAAPRTSFDFRSDGTVVRYEAGPDDRPVGDLSFWKLHGDIVSITRQDAPPVNYIVVSVDTSRLVLRKQH